MRLVHTTTYNLQEFEGRPPLYAALSHRWGEHEVSFQKHDAGKVASRADDGYNKIYQSCQIAAGNGYDWIWVDTCCIDKTSSAELSEAINSMYGWYSRAGICIAHLHDVICDPKDDAAALESQLRRSEWFKRGWTLQELLAPSTVLFYARDWSVLGHIQRLRYRIEDDKRRVWYCLRCASEKAKVGTHIDQIVAQGAGIDVKYLQYLDLHNSSISAATKMTWMRHRKTTRIEDMAYCLLGLFDIHMPPLYGEGDKAFKRLQMEIINNSADESIFAWNRSEHMLHGMLASDPSLFLDGIVSRGVGAFDTRSFEVTNKGLLFTAEFCKVAGPKAIGDAEYALPLACYHESDKSTPITLSVKEFAGQLWTIAAAVPSVPTKTVMMRCYLNLT